MVDFAIFATTMLWGITIGWIYILLATGLNLIFGVMKLVNFAHGELLMLGAYMCWSFSTWLGLNAYVAILPSMAVVGLMGIVIERLAFRKVMGSNKLNEIFVSLGLIYILDQIVVLGWGKKDKKVESPFSTMNIDLGPVSIRYDLIIVAVVAILILIFLYLLLSRTKVGRVMRATSQNREAAMLLGVNIGRIYTISFALGAALAAAGGSLYSLIYIFDPAMGAMPSVKAFAIIIMGGLGSIKGAVIAGLLYGIAENLAVLFLGGIWGNAIAFVLLIAVLVVKPSGIFGEKTG